MRRSAVFILIGAACALLLGACASGPVRRVSEPAASLQQVTVRADGTWSIELRLNNFSSVPMRFDRVELPLTIGGEAAGTLQGAPALTIGPESADVATLEFAPSAAARIAIADALVAKRNLAYSFEGTVTAAPEDRKPRDFKIKRSSALSPVPGLPGVMR